MITLADIVCTTVVPFTAAVVLACFMSRWKKAQSLAPAIAVAGGFWAGKLAADLRDAWATCDMQLAASAKLIAATRLAMLQQAQPTEAHDWLSLLGLVSAICFGLTIASNQRSWFLFGGLSMALLIPLRMLWSSVYFVRDWGAVELCLRMAGIVVCLALPALALPRWSRDGNRPRCVLMPILVAMGLLAAAMTLMLTGSKTYGELGGMLAFAFLGAWCGGLLSGMNLGYDDLPVVSMLLGGLAVLGCAYSATPVWQVLVLGAGMATACCVLPTGHETSPLRRLCAVVILITCVGAVAGVAAWRFAQATSTENPYSQYMN